MHDRIAQLPDPDLVTDGGRGINGLVDRVDGVHPLARRSRNLARLLFKMTESQLQIVILKGIFGIKTNAEVAQILGVSEGAIRQRAAWSRKKMKTRA